jgi:hypothetical protein
MTTTELRRFATRLELRDVQAVGKPYKYLEGRAVPYDTAETVGWFRELHARGSFKQSTTAGRGQNAPLLLFHDNRNFPIGHAEEWTHADGGLDGVWVLNDSPEAQRAATMAEAGDLVGMSVGFQPIRSSWAWADDWAPELGPEHMDTVTRQESALVEVSLTPTPAFSDAQVVLVRSALGTGCRAEGAPDPQSALNAWREVVDGLRSATSD